MPQLRGKERAKLPDSAFAYVDSRGRRSLPIHDEAHVRNALARFDRVLFENDAARATARARLLRAAKRHGIVPLGFLDRQLRPERRLPTGRVTLLMADVEDSSGLLDRLGTGYGAVIDDVRRRIRAAVRAAGGREVDARADEYFASFESAAAAVDAAVRIQRDLTAREDGPAVRVRIGVHTGRPALTPGGYVGLAVNTVARVCAAGHGRQIVASAAVRGAVGDDTNGEIQFRPLGLHRLRGIPGGVELFQVAAPGLQAAFPPLRS